MLNYLFTLFLGTIRQSNFIIIELLSQNSIKKTKKKENMQY